MGSSRRSVVALSHAREQIEFVGESHTIKQLLSEARMAAQGSDRPILIRGGIGSGKTHLARYIHQFSGRAKAPFHVVDCGALPGLDNILFGHRAGSFTGATQDLQGRLARAHGGTLVLDDFERLRLEQQDLLHRVVVDGCHYAIGASDPRAVDLRIIATTNKPIQEEIDAGRLRADFVSRLSYFELVIPLLSRRQEDIPALCKHLLERKLEERSSRESRPTAEVQFDERCWPLLKARTFSDSVRGLDKLVERLLAYIGPRDVICPSDIEAVAPVQLTAEDPWFEQAPSLRSVREAAERRYILKVCRHTGFNLRKAARSLQISPKCLYDKLKRYGISRP